MPSLLQGNNDFQTAKYSSCLTISEQLSFFFPELILQLFGNADACWKQFPTWKQKVLWIDHQREVMREGMVNKVHAFCEDHSSTLL